MKAITTLVILMILISSCRQSNKTTFRFDNISKSDTTCLKELKIAKKDRKTGKLIYCNYTQWPLLRCVKEMTLLLEKYNIQLVNEFASDVIIDGQTDGCYCDYMKEQIDNKYGKKFIDSLLYVADSVYISKNLDKIYDYSGWDKPPLFPGDIKFDNANHSGLQKEFDKLISYPSNYKYRVDSISLADVNIYLEIDEYGKAKVGKCIFDFWNNKTKDEGYNKEIYQISKKIFIPLIEKTKWTPAKIKSFNIKSKSEIYIYFK